MKISKFTVNPFSESTFILWTEEGGVAAVVDPGMSNQRECEALKRFIEENNLTLKMVLLTHQHVDHIMGTGYLTEQYGCPVYAHAGDVEMGQKSDVQLRAFNMQCEMKPFKVTNLVEDGDVIDLGGETIHVIHTPGHSAGGVVYYLPESNCALVGDTIFQMSIGRTDLAGGDYDTLINSIITKLLVLPEDTELFPGHGGVTSVAFERQYNPFLK